MLSALRLTTNSYWQTNRSFSLDVTLLLILRSQYEQPHFTLLNTNKQDWDDSVDDNPLKDIMMTSVHREACKHHCLYMGQNSPAGSLAPTFSCDQCPLNIRRHMGLMVPFWTSWLSRQQQHPPPPPPFCSRKEEGDMPSNFQAVQKTKTNMK